MPSNPNTTGSVGSQNTDSGDKSPETSSEDYQPLDTGEGVIRESWEEATAQFSKYQGNGSYTTRFYFGRSNDARPNDN